VRDKVAERDGRGATETKSPVTETSLKTGDKVQLTNSKSEKRSGTIKADNENATYQVKGDEIACIGGKIPIRASEPARTANLSSESETKPEDKTESLASAGGRSGGAPPSGERRAPPGMDPDEFRIREQTLEKLRAHPEEYLAEYRAQFGNVLNADEAATLFDEYNKNPAKYRVAIHPAATRIRDELFRRALAEQAPEGKNRVVFTAGANAAGKSTALAVSGSAKYAQVVFDSTFSNPEHAKRLLEQALAAGKTVAVVHVSRPLEDIFQAMLDRAKHQGRVVTIEQIIGSHGGSAQAMHILSREFGHNPNVEFVFIDNASHAARIGTLELTALRDYTEIRERLYDLLDAEYQAGRITEENYRRIRGRDRGQPPRDPSDG